MQKFCEVDPPPEAVAAVCAGRETRLRKIGRTTGSMPLDNRVVAAKQNLFA